MTKPARRLKLTWAHLIVVGVAWVAAATMVVNSCLIYNDFAGTDKTPWHIAIVALSTPMGPLTGHLINPSGGFAIGMKWFLILFPILALAVSPFLCLRREVGRTTHFVAWTGYVIGVGFWFFTSVVSVGMSLK